MRTQVIGITGGIGAGKSTGVKRMAALGMPVYDCDARVHFMYQRPDFLEALGRHVDVRSAPKAAVKERLAQDPDFLDTLVELIRPYLQMDFDAFLADHAGHRHVVMDAPLLFEWEWDSKCDGVISIIVAVEERLKRALARTSPRMQEADFWRMVQRQVSDDVRMERSSRVVDGHGTPDEVAQRFDAAVESLLADLSRNPALAAETMHAKIGA